MQGFESTTGPQQSNLFASALHQANSLFTSKRVGYSVAGAFVIAGAATLYASTSATNTSSTRVNGYSVHTATDSSTQPATGSVPPIAPSVSTDTTVSAASTTGSSPEVHMSVNGQTITVPSNGTTQQTVTNPDGSQTSINATSSSTQGTASNENSTNFSLNVTSNSSTGGMTSP
jgi:hypothetical protein